MTPDSTLRQLAESRGRPFQAVLDEALWDYIDRQQKERPRRHVVASIASSIDEFDTLYRELAKQAVMGGRDDLSALVLSSGAVPLMGIPEHRDRSFRSIVTDDRLIVTGDSGRT